MRGTSRLFEDLSILVLIVRYNSCYHTKHTLLRTHTHTHTFDHHKLDLKCWIRWAFHYNGIFVKRVYVILMHARNHRARPITCPIYCSAQNMISHNFAPWCITRVPDVNSRQCLLLLHKFVIEIYARHALSSALRNRAKPITFSKVRSRKFVEREIYRLSLIEYHIETYTQHMCYMYYNTYICTYIMNRRVCNLCEQRVIEIPGGIALVRFSLSSVSRTYFPVDRHLIDRYYLEANFTGLCICFAMYGPGGKCDNQD